MGADVDIQTPRNFYVNYEIICRRIYLNQGTQAGAQDHETSL